MQRGGHKEYFELPGTALPTPQSPAGRLSMQHQRGIRVGTDSPTVGHDEENTSRRCSDTRLNGSPDRHDPTSRAILRCALQIISLQIANLANLVIDTI
jgi:hypothetical protein